MTYRGHSLSTAAHAPAFAADLLVIHQTVSGPAWLAGIQAEQTASAILASCRTAAISGADPSHCDAFSFEPRVAQ